MQQRAQDGVRPSQRAAWPLVAVTIVVAVEAAGLAASALGVAVYLLLGNRPHDPLDAWLIVVFAGVGSAVLALAWRGFRRRRRWSRAPIVLAQLLALPVGYNAIGDGAWWLGAPLLVCGVVGLVGMFAPSTTHEFFGG